MVDVGVGKVPLGPAKPPSRSGNILIWMCANLASVGVKPKFRGDNLGLV